MPPNPMTCTGGRREWTAPAGCPLTSTHIQRKLTWGTAEVARWLRALSDFPEDLGSPSSTQTAQLSIILAQKFKAGVVS